MTEALRLYTFSLSHFSEKIRWTLGVEQIPFIEIPWVPTLHMAAARRRGRGTTVPVIEIGDVRVQDSTRILHWLDKNRGPLALLPKDETARAEVFAIERRFDDIGGHVMRLAYSHVLPDTGAVVKLWTIDATPMQARMLRLFFPMFRALFRRRLDTSGPRVDASRAQIEESLRFIEERTAKQPYLVGDALSVADVTAASLLAPLVCPDEHPVYASDAFRSGIAPVVGAWARRPAFDWVRGIYREHRGEWPRADEIRRTIAASS